MDYCAVFGCRNSITSLNKRKADCKFFNFPLHKSDLTELWLREVNLEGWIPGPESVICEEHFSSDSLEIVDNKKVLKTEAVPCIVDELDRILLHYEIHLDNQSAEPTAYSPGKENLRCRICATSIGSQDAIDVYSEDETIIVKIRTCIPILVKTRDFLPKYVCRACLSDLNTSYRMLMRAVESEKFFSNLLISEQESDNLIIAEETSPHPGKPFHLPDARTDLQCDETSDQNLCAQERHNLELDFTASAVSEPLENLNSELESSELAFSIIEVSESIDPSSQDHVNDIKCDTLQEEISASLETESPKLLESVPEAKSCPLFTCSYCSTTYESEERMNEHLETHVVSVWYEDNESKDKHMDTENTSSPTSICKICFIVFPTSQSLERHMKRVHNLKYVANETVLKYTCKECGKEFKNKLAFTVHERIHTGARPFVCENCGNSFRSRANLIQHHVIHTGVKKYKCAVCNKAFSRKGFVDAHMRVHTGERPFKCNICESTYTQVGDLRRHMQKCQRVALSEKRIVVRRNYCKRVTSRARNSAANFSTK